MGGASSTPRNTGSDDVSVAEYLISTFVGEKSFPLASDYWNKLLELPLSSRWPSDRVHQACELFGRSNGYTRHLAKLLIHLSWCLQELLQDSDDDQASSIYKRAVNATYILSVFLKHLIENGKSDGLEELHLSLDESEPVPHGFVMDQDIQNFVMHSVLNFIGSTEVSLNSYVLHQELLKFMIVAMSTQLLSGPSPGPRDANPFIDAAMSQEKSLVCLAVRRLLLNYISRTPQMQKPICILMEIYQAFWKELVLQLVATFVLLPLNYLVNNSGDGSKHPLAEFSLHVLLILTNYHKPIMSDEFLTDKSYDSATSESISKGHAFSSGNIFSKALANARDVEFDRSDVEGNAYLGPHVRIPFASLFDTLGMCLADEGAVLLLYSLLQGNSDFKENVLVQTDLDTMILPSVPWYKEHLLHQMSLGSLMVIILIRTVQYNLSKLRDVYLQTTCLATLANMAPHAHHLSAYASQRLVSLFYMLSRKYNKLSELTGEKLQSIKISFAGEGDGVSEDLAAELQIFTDFLRRVLDILNAILTYALPRNPEIVYAVMHRQEVFQPFKNHQRFHELVENIYTMFTQLHFSYEQEGHPKEFFIPYVWQLVFSRCGFSFSPDAINLFPVPHQVEKQEEDGRGEVVEEGKEKKVQELIIEQRIVLDP
uniref:Dymeclin n=1 Tax=Brassica campestris TaxID=3711 RepID=M4DFM1_BRACM